MLVPIHFVTPIMAVVLIVHVTNPQAKILSGTIADEWWWQEWIGYWSKSCWGYSESPLIRNPAAPSFCYPPPPAAEAPQDACPTTLRPGLGNFVLPQFNQRVRKPIMCCVAIQAVIF